MKSPFTLLGTEARGFQLLPSTQPNEVSALLGEASDSWDDGVEHCLEYHTDEVSLRLYWVIGSLLGVRRLTFKNVDIEFSNERPTFKKKEPNQPSQRNTSTGSVPNLKSPARRG